MTDVAESNLTAWRNHPQLAEPLKAGILDFALFDLEQSDRLELLQSGVVLGPGVLRNPVVALANYAFDSIRQDAFAIQDGELLECRLTLDAPSNVAESLVNGEGASLDPIRMGHDYRSVELPYYNDTVLDGLLGDYLEQLDAGHVSMPLNAMRATRSLANLSQQGLMLITGDMGEHHLEDLRNTPPPEPTRHGSVAFKVNYDAVGRWVEDRGGLALQPQVDASGLAVNVFFIGLDEDDLHETLPVCDEILDGLGPDSYFVIKKRFDEHLHELSFNEILASLKLSRWDVRILQLCQARLLVLTTTGLTLRQQETLQQAVENIWQGYFDLGEEYDLAFDLGALLVNAGLFEEGLPFLQHSLQRSGEHSATFFNMGVAHAHEQRWEAALECSQRALALDGGSQEAANLQRQVEAAQNGDATAVVLRTVGKPTVSRPRPQPYEDNLSHLQGELAVLNLRLEKELARWRSTHPPEATSEQLMGYQLSELGADLTLAGLSGNASSERLDDDTTVTAPALVPSAALHAEREHAAREAGVALRLPQLAERLGLNEFERAVVLLALAPDLEPRYERLFGYLNDDIYRRWPTVELALRLFCPDPTEMPRCRRSLDSEAPLFARRLLYFPEENVSRTLRTRGLRLEERTAKFLLQGNDTDPVLEGFLEMLQERWEVEGKDITQAISDQDTRSEITALTAHLASQPKPAPIVMLNGPDALLLRRVSAHLAPGDNVLVLRGQAVAAAENPADLIARALREADLTGRALVVDEANAFGAKGRPGLALHRLLTSPCRWPCFLLCPEPWSFPEPCLSVPVLNIHIPAPDHASRRILWQQALSGLEEDFDLSEIAGRFNLRSAQIDGAVSRVRARLGAANGNGYRASYQEIYAACRAQCSTSIEGLAQHIESVHTWDDLILPKRVITKLKSMERWLRYRHRVFDDWGFGQRVMAGNGMAALFSGSSGTGKTMAAGVIARSLDLDLYRIDLSSVVSKYIGETEKNLARVFDTAEEANAVLFFDEADALFGKRSEVKDSHDRYANIEVSYLLQRMESYGGIAILATNIRDNLDAAFTRRLQVIVDFPFPDFSYRERIWRRLLPEQVPQADDVDHAFLAKQFNLTGGSIKNCALNAALFAAANATPVTMEILTTAVALEFEKMGKPMTANQMRAPRDA